MPHYDRVFPVMISSNPLQVPAAVANEKYLLHHKSPSSYAVIRREMPYCADLAESVSELSKSVEVA